MGSKVKKIYIFLFKFLVFAHSLPNDYERTVIIGFGVELGQLC